MRLFSYVVVWDKGFAPNPYHGYLTLACCKPRIRKAAKEGDWIVGTLSYSRFPNMGGRMLYAAEVSEVLPINSYWRDLRFEKKKPNMQGKPENRCGDNIYSYNSQTSAISRQLPSFHSHEDGGEDSKSMKHDLGGENVLVCSNFVYFGRNAKVLPASLECIRKKGPGHKSRFDQNNIDAFLKYLYGVHQHGKGEILGDPIDMELPQHECRKCVDMARKEDGTEADDA